MHRGVKSSTPQELPRSSDRITFCYLEHCTIGRDANALTATDAQEVLYIPSAALSALLLGPGTRVTHQAMTVIADSGCTVAWVGAGGVRYYAHGRPLGRSTALLERQARLVSNQRLRLAVARRMYALRFPDHDPAGLTMQQLRGHEGRRVRDCYSRWSKQTGVEWRRRDYKVDDFEDSDLINKALSMAHACLYALTHAVIVQLGCSPALGFIHTGHDRSFVYDVADLFKASTSIPVAFETVAEIQRNQPDREEVSTSDLSALVRRRMRDQFMSRNILTKTVDIIYELFVDETRLSAEDDFLRPAVLELWDNHQGTVGAGINYYSLDADPPW